MSAEIEYISPRSPQPVHDLDRATGASPAVDNHELFALLRRAAEHNASDVHLVAGQPAVLRVNGKLESPDPQRLNGETIRQMLAAALPKRAAEIVGDSHDVDCSLQLPSSAGGTRFRVNAYRAQGNWNACFRLIAGTVPTLAQLGFPESVSQHLIQLHDGLVIFTGTTGSGKSSSMAALIQQMAERHRLHVLTIEEPIEYQFASRMGSLFSQREVGRDVPDFATGLKYGLRQDPDVILVGETRDRDTAQMVLSAAETGHLVLTTLHTRDAKGALSRFVDLFPAAQHEEARKLLAMSLRSVVSQHLLPGIGTSGRRVLATEVLHNSQQAEVAIRSGRFETLDSVIQTGRRDGMYTLDDDLERLVKAGKLPADVAQRLRKRSDGNSASRAGAWS